jgi:hypothetical protein
LATVGLSLFFAVYADGEPRTKTGAHGAHLRHILHIPTRSSDTISFFSAERNARVLAFLRRTIGQ